ncbi:MAG TPA: hypothetical protein VND91_01265 [Candidatus Saccharimonadia bacterium]|nr:hypothetical protein [Candidatus Saccharimonadia bacterium]
MIATHVVLLALLLWASLPYVYTQVMLAVELVIFSLATVALYRDRAGELLVDTVKLAAGLVFILAFVIATYGVTREGGNGKALATALQSLREVGATTALWAVCYIAIHAAIALGQAWAAPDPRKAWFDNAMAESGATFVAMLMMVFVAGLFGRPIVELLQSDGAQVDADVVLGCLMVAVRCFIALVVAVVMQRRRGAMVPGAAHG